MNLSRLFTTQAFLAVINTNPVKMEQVLKRKIAHLLRVLQGPLSWELGLLDGAVGSG